MYDYNEMRKDFIDVDLIANKKSREVFRNLLKEALDSGDRRFIEDIEEDIILEQVSELRSLQEQLLKDYPKGALSVENNAGDTISEYGMDRESSVTKLFFYRMATDIDAILMAQAEADM